MGSQLQPNFGCMLAIMAIIVIIKKKTIKKTGIFTGIVILLRETVTDSNKLSITKPINQYKK